MRKCNSETKAYSSKIWNLGKGGRDLGSFSNSHSFTHLKVKKNKTIAHTLQNIYEHMLGRVSDLFPTVTEKFFFCNSLLGHSHCPCVLLATVLAFTVSMWNHRII